MFLGIVPGDLDSAAKAFIDLKAELERKGCPRDGTG
jgi:hypothetical protein